MSLIGLLVLVLILGVIAYALNSIPMPQPFKVAAICILCIILILAIASMFGVVPWHSGVVVR